MATNPPIVFGAIRTDHVLALGVGVIAFLAWAGTVCYLWRHGPPKPAACCCQAISAECPAHD